MIACTARVKKHAARAYGEELAFSARAGGNARDAKRAWVWGRVFG